MDKIKKALHTLELANLAGEDIQKARVTKYYRREGGPGNYKYYYTKAEYDKAKGVKKEEKRGSGFNNFNFYGVEAGDELEYIVPGTNNEVSVGIVESKGSTRNEDYVVLTDGKRIFTQNISGMRKPEKEIKKEEVWKLHLGSEDGPLTEVKVGDKLVLTEKAKNFDTGNDDNYFSLRGVQQSKGGVFTFTGMDGGAIRVKDDTSDKTHILSASRFNKVGTDPDVHPVKSLLDGDEDTDEKVIRVKDLLTDLVNDPPEGFYEDVADTFGEPDDDGESESALIERIMSGAPLSMVEDWVHEQNSKSTKKEIRKAEYLGALQELGLDIEKGRTREGVYANTSENRKLGRVGQKYKKKDSVEDKKEGKKESSSPKKEVEAKKPMTKKEELESKIEGREYNIRKEIEAFGYVSAKTFKELSKLRKELKELNGEKVEPETKKEDSVEDKKEGKKESSSPKERDLTGMVVNDVIDDIEKDISKFWRINAVDTSPLGGTFKRIHFSSLEWSNPIREYIKGKYGVDPKLEHNVRAGSVTLKIPKKSIVNMRKYLTDKEFRQSVSEQARHGTLVGGKGRPVRS